MPINRIGTKKLILIIILICMLSAALVYLTGVIKRKTGSEDAQFLSGIRLPEPVGYITLNEGAVAGRPLGVVTTSDRKIYVADSSGNRILVYNLKGKLLAKWESFGKGDRFAYPTSVVVDEKRNIAYIADFNNSRILEIDSGGRLIGVIPSESDRKTLGSFQPTALSLDGNGNIYATDVSGQRVVIFNTQGQIIRTFGSRGINEGELSFPNGIAVDYAGKTVYVSDTNNGRVQILDSQGKTQKVIYAIAAKGLVTPRGIALDEKRQVLYIADTITHTVFAFHLKTGTGTAFGRMGNGIDEFNFPNGLAINERYLLIADRDNHRIALYEYKDQTGR